MSACVDLDVVRKGRHTFFRNSISLQEAEDHVVQAVERVEFVQRHLDDPREVSLDVTASQNVPLRLGAVRRRGKEKSSVSGCGPCVHRGRQEVKVHEIIL